MTFMKLTVVHWNNVEENACEIITVLSSDVVFKYYYYYDYHYNYYFCCNFTRTFFLYISSKRKILDIQKVK